LFALAIGGGVLSKGPVILVHLLPAALLGPYWTATPWAGAWRHGYAWLLVAVVAGAVLALAWAVPAGLRGGEAYGDAIFWGQSAGRLVKSFAHQEPFWWYAAILPAMVLPWAVWPAALRRLWRLVRPVESHATGGFDAGRRLLAIWAIATFVILSVISGKRPHYLLPIFPALALAGALLLSQIGDPAGERKPRRDLSGPVGLVMLVAAVLTLTPWLAPVLGHPEWADDIDILWTLPPIVGGAWLLWRPPGRLAARTLAIACIGALAVMSLQGFLAGKLDRIYDLRPTARHLAALQKDGRAIAHYGKYHGQFNFLGRLAKPLEETGDAEVVDWLRRHPGGKVLSYHRRLPAGAKPDFQQRFRGRIIAIWDGAAVLANPDIAKRGSE
jgi:4-amino-4-deoxy-L-arabinose transferase-like glycosyltransferase